MRNLVTVFLSISLLTQVIAGQSAGPYATLFNQAQLKSTIRFLSDDGFEGRGPGSRGGELSAKFIAQQLESAGIEPGHKGSYFQPVSLVSVKTNPSTRLVVAGKGTASEFTFGDQFVGNTEAQREKVSVDAEMIFVGHGIEAPEERWNDFKGDRSRYKGKVLVIMVNEPAATTEEPNRFGGRALTYAGRWTYKYEQAARLGAAGVILIHTDESAGYGWNVVRTSNGNWRFDIARTAGDDTPFLDFRSWITDETARKIFAQAGKDLDKLRAAASRRDFEPVDLGLRAKIDLNSELRSLESNNVIGFWPGSDPVLKDQHIIYTAHWDHIGIGEPNASGDRIYNGALDNASGIAQVLAIAKAMSQLPAAKQPKRSQLFVFTTAEEQGLLGAEWYARFPSFPLSKSAANINIDGGNFFGITRDYGALGAERSVALWDTLNAVLAERSMRYLPDANPEQGFFFRSDHFPFVKKGIPALSIQSGKDYVGKPAGWADAFFKEYNTKHYHQPSDEFDESWVFDGMVQMLDITMDVALRISNLPRMPRYKETDEFFGAQPNRQ
jgi:Zn-dependent M28 family amino/carboxypeptidase